MKITISEGAVNLAAVGALGATMIVALATKADGAKDICLALGGGLVGFLTRSAVDWAKSHLTPAADAPAQ